VGQRAIAGERERIGGEKKRRKKKGGRPGRYGCKPAGHFQKKKVSNVWHSATLETTNVAPMHR
jgi:hypothetical protein